MCFLIFCTVIFYRFAYFLKFRPIFSHFCTFLKICAPLYSLSCCNHIFIFCWLLQIFGTSSYSVPIPSQFRQPSQPPTFNHQCCQHFHYHNHNLCHHRCYNHHCHHNLIQLLPCYLFVHFDRCSSSSHGRQAWNHHFLISPGGWHWEKFINWELRKYRLEQNLVSPSRKWDKFEQNLTRISKSQNLTSPGETSSADEICLPE